VSDVPVDSVKSLSPQEEAPSPSEKADASARPDEEATRSAEGIAATPEAKEPPDPGWGVGVGLLGLVVMATGGAGTWHWIFNAGEFIMLAGAAMFIGAVSSTSLRQRPLRLRLRWAAWRLRWAAWRLRWAAWRERRTGAAD
jgi:hypothetical protein